MAETIVPKKSYLNITITLKAENTGGNGSNQSNTEKSGTKAEDQGQITNSAAVYASQVAKRVMGDIITQAEWQINYSLKVSDNYIAQREYQVANQAISAVSNYASSLLTGASAGASLGPAGAVIGAVVGLGLSIGETALNNYRQGKEQDLRLDQEQAQLDYTRKRAGYSLNAASIGEDL